MTALWIAAITVAICGVIHTLLSLAELQRLQRALERRQDHCLDLLFDTMRRVRELESRSGIGVEAGPEEPATTPHAAAPCAFCWHPEYAHGPAGESPLGGPKDRLCPKPGVTSQFYTPRPANADTEPEEKP